MFQIQHKIYCKIGTPYYPTRQAQKFHFIKPQEIKILCLFKIYIHQTRPSGTSQNKICRMCERWFWGPYGVDSLKNDEEVFINTLECS